MKMAHPILNFEQSSKWEKLILKDDERFVGEAMESAGYGIGQCILRDYTMLKVWAEQPQVLVIIGKGHNAGDALIAAEYLHLHRPGMRLKIVAVLGVDDFRPNVKKVYDRLVVRANVDVLALDPHQVINEGVFKERLIKFLEPDAPIDVCIDGIFGLNFKPPLQEPVVSVLRAINAWESIGMRVAVDVPSGVHDLGEVNFAFKADFTYCPAVFKKAMLHPSVDAYAGRVRYVDIGFFETASEDDFKNTDHWCVVPTVLDSLKRLREAKTDKRSYGHLLIVAGSRTYPGALIMAARSALSSGVGLVTVCTCDSLVPALSIAAPEIMWRGCPQTETGFLSDKALEEILFMSKEVSALLIGPGIGRDVRTQTLIQNVIKAVDLPMVIDADALFADNIQVLREKKESSRHPVIITPHLGELKRLLGFKNKDTVVEKDFREYLKKFPELTLVLKGSLTQVWHHDRGYVCPFGGPVLARGGSGDVLSGLITGLLTQQRASGELDALKCALQAVAWGGMAAERLACAKGERSVHTIEILDFLSAVLHEG